jgi:SAM-dependent methyltransferase
MHQAEEYVKLAQEAWNEAAPIHWRVTRALLDEIKDSTRRDIHQIQLDELQRIGLEGRRVAHLNCNNGRELITMTRLGARGSIGFDISAGFIGQAEELAKAAGVDCRFVCTDIYKIGSEFDAQFDLVVVTAGALAFMPDLTAYFSIARRMLKPEGKLTVYEAHPVTRMFLKDRDRRDKPVELVQSYFAEEPLRHETGLDDQGGTIYEAKPIYYFQHKLADVISACINAGFAIEKFGEYDRDPSQSRTSLETFPATPPLSYILTCRRDEGAGTAGNPV